MYTLICNLRFQDGAEIEARLSTTTPVSLSPVEWRGPLDRIPSDRLQVARASTLRAQAKALASRLNAQLNITSSGKFDREER